ncbi:hypothetical protein QPL78_09710 [Bacillus halotolerans]|uniref:hypothetical protein n=1 Tax=Bacillus halotolerans TaxID=260554 RepID=UPI0025402A5B|nr:hypothetical protein [Bacillus halotolerans]WIG48754.1 hypothetical protein QPL78_09710 [Bacillus halotolerans]
MEYKQMWAYQFDENYIYGCPVEIQYIEDDDGNVKRVVPENATEISPGDLVQAKWTGTEWVESASTEYIEALETADSDDESDGAKALKAVADILETMVRGDAG